MSEARREADAAPCDVVVAVFVFGVERCRANALFTIAEPGLPGRWRICGEHLEGNR